MKSYGVTIQMKPLQQYFHTVLYFYYVVLTFPAVDQILWCNQAKKVVLSIMVPYIKYAVRFFQPMVMDKTLWFNLACARLSDSIVGTY